MLKIAQENIPSVFYAVDKAFVVAKSKQVPGEEKPKKIPYQINGKAAKSDDISTWSSLIEALRAYDSGNYDYIWLVMSRFKKQNLVVIDVDYPQGSEKFNFWLDKFKYITYCELSPSNNLRIYAYADIGDVKSYVNKCKADSKLEFYSYLDTRFMSVTGNKLNTLDISNCEAAIKETIVSTFTDTIKISSDPIVAAELSDDEIERRKGLMLKSASGEKIKALMNGDKSGHDDDDSKADMALCCHLAFWMAKDRYAMDKVFRESKLMRPKWDEFRGQYTYGYQTINRAVESVTEVLSSERRSWKDDYDKLVEDLNQRFASTFINGKHRIIEFIPASSTNDKVTTVYYDAKNLKDGYHHTSIRIGGTDDKPKFADHITAWMKHPKIRMYSRGVVFEPGLDVDEGYFNLWRGFAVKPVENKALLGPVWHHLKDVMCSGKEDIYQYVLKWLAHSFQHPNTPGYTALVFRGDKGTGKSTLMSKLLLPIWGLQGMHIHNSNHLVGNFNKILANTCLLFADEAFYAGDKKHESVLKGLITDESIIIEPKGVDSYLQRNYLKVVMATNSDYAVPVSRNERRYCVCDVSDVYRGNADYFKMLCSTLESDAVRSAFLYEMLNLDISGWRPSIDIPETKGLREQRFESFEPHKLWLAESLYADKWSSEMTTAELYADYMCWVADNRIPSYRIVGSIAISKYLGKIYKRVSYINGDFKRGFILGKNCEATHSFEKYERISLDELIEG